MKAIHMCMFDLLIVPVVSFGWRLASTYRKTAKCK